jgi:predicted ATPase
MIHLRSIQPRALPARPDYPFSLQLIQNFKGISFDSPVTLLVGENGSGKSTILEALACAADMIIVGSESSRNDKSLVHARELAKYFKLIWTKRIRRGFFLRAEDFFGYAKRLNQMRTEMESDLQEIDSEFKDRSDYARYGEGLDARSHGESFLSLFQSRFVPDGLYLLDEPEAPLSPIRQLALIATIKDMVAQNGQFIIATHSPILMAYPEATLLNFTEGQILPAHYDELEHIRLMRDFLNDPQAFVRNL